MRMIYLNIICLLLWGWSSFPIFAKDSVVVYTDIEQHSGREDYKTSADNAYTNGDYNLAIQLYEQIIENQGESAEIYYNIGNSYYKKSDIAKAILNYERAILLDPGDSDIRFNLDFAKSKTVDQITPLGEVFFVTWAKKIVNIQNSDAWARFAVLSFMIFLISILVYMFNGKIIVRKITFFLAIFFLLLCVVANLSSNYQKNKFVERKNAIVMYPSVTVKSTPDMSGTDLFVLHEGCKVEIKDNSLQKWIEIKLEDGNVGWMPSDALEII